MTKRQIRHTVSFSLKHAPGSAEAEAFLRDGRAALAGIPGVKNFEALRQVSPKNDLAFGFSMEFDDAEAFAAYLAHPAHAAFVRERWDAEVTRFLETDYQAL